VPRRTSSVGPATISARESTITFDGSAGTGELYPGPADLLAAALAACILKNVERFSRLPPFRYEHLQLARTWHTPGLEWAAATLFLALIAFWITVATRTTRAILTGQAWQR
jgi:hypothetical protein